MARPAGHDDGAAVAAMPTAAEVLTHVGPDGAARMVDVGGKPVSRRRAVAEVVVSLPAGVRLPGGEGELRGPKGAVLETARLAGIQAAKRTWELVPLCHPLALDRVEVRCRHEAERGEVWIEAEAAAEARTGVEMEALTAALVAALTVYDMLKAVAPGMVIGPARLLEKTGGRADYRAASRSGAGATAAGAGAGGAAGAGP